MIYAAGRTIPVVKNNGRMLINFSGPPSSPGGSGKFSDRTVCGRHQRIV